MGTVFISQDAEGRNFLPAADYGRLQLILPATAQVVLTARPALGKLRYALRNFTDEDLLLLSGDPIIMALAVTVALNANMGRARLLKWDRFQKAYYEVAVDLNEVEDVVS